MLNLLKDKNKKFIFMPEVKLTFDDNNLTRLLYGDLNKNLNIIEKSIGVSVKTRLLTCSATLE